VSTLNYVLLVPCPSLHQILAMPLVDYMQIFDTVSWVTGWASSL